MLSIANEVDPLIFHCICFVCYKHIFFQHKYLSLSVQQSLNFLQQQRLYVLLENSEGCLHSNLGGGRGMWRGEESVDSQQNGAFSNSYSVGFFFATCSLTIPLGNIPAPCHAPKGKHLGLFP